MSNQAESQDAMLGRRSKRLLGRRHFAILSFIGLALIGVIWGGVLAHLANSRAEIALQNRLCLSNLQDMTAQQLRKVVADNHLHLFWAGPQENMKYRLNALDPAAITLTVVPAIQEKRGRYPQFTTYKQSDAFKQVLDYGKGHPAVASFINSAGNSVFYTRQRPEIAYVGMKDQDFQVEIFSPVPGESLEIATRAGRLLPVR